MRAFLGWVFWISLATFIGFGVGVLLSGLADSSSAQGAISLGTIILFIAITVKVHRNDLRKSRPPATPSP